MNLTSIYRSLEEIASSSAPLTMSSKSNRANSSSPSSYYPLRCGEVLREFYINASGYQNRTAETFAKSSKQWLADVAAVNAGGGQSCHCSLLLQIPWYPCEVRFCPNPTANRPDEFGNPQPEMYRCGIKTCRKRFEFRFAVRDKLFCLGDFDSTVYSIDDRMSDANDSSEEQRPAASVGDDELPSGDDHNLRPAHDHI